jgi:diacylglycerol O-acyltransferase
VSVPISARRDASATQLGNQVGAIPLALPATGDPRLRLEAIVGITRERKTAAPASSAALLGPAFRTLARLGIFRRFVDGQRLITTFVTNLRGPAEPLSFLGTPITEVIPVSMITGNITVAFAVLSYAGKLVVAVVADPETCPDLPVLVAQLQSELDTVTADPGDGRAG